MAQDLRSFLDLLREKGDLAHVRREVDPRYEIAGVMRRSAEQGGPALYFENVHGRKIPLVGNVLGSRRRMAWALGAEPQQALKAYRNALESARKPVNVDAAAQVEPLPGLSSLPIITSHEHDAGPYMTSSIVFSQHPDSEIINLSFHRMCPISENEVAIYVGDTSDLAAHGRAARTRRLPVVVCNGLHPAFLMVAASRFPAEMQEIELVGGILGEPVRLTKDRLGRWLVPEGAEIVLEGEIDFERTVPEGPFGEYPGYYGAGTLKPRPSPVLTFHSMRTRKAPIFQTVITGPTMSYESTYFSGLSKEAMLYTVLSRMSPNVRSVNILLSRYIAVVQLEGGVSEGDAKKLLEAVFVNMNYIKFAVLVDMDIDPGDPLDVLWALSTRVNPGKHMYVFPNMVMEPLDPSTPGVCDKVGFDARKPAGDEQEGFVRTRIPGFEKIRLEDYLSAKS